MNRKMRRALEKNNDQAAKRAIQQQRQAEKDQIQHDMILGMYIMMGLKLHEVFGFGGQRLMRLYEAIDEECGRWQREGLDIQKLAKEMQKKTGIEIPIE